MADSSKNRKDPFLDAQALELYEAVNEFVRIHQFRDRDRICCYDVSVTQCSALELVIQNGPLRLQALAQQMLLDKSTTSRVIETLVRKNYVTRLPDPEDSRAVLIQATAAGRKLFQKIHSELIDEQKEIIADLAPEVRTAATALLQRLTGAAARRMGVGESCRSEKSGRGSC
jgi:DNA-binding MarR family transcriptional regulator